MSIDFKVPKGFEQYLSRQRNAISRLKHPVVEVRQGFLILNPAAVKAIGPRGHVVLLYNGEQKECGLWFFKNPVTGSCRVNGRSKRDLRYIAFRGFRHHFLDEGVAEGPLICDLLQDKAEKDFFRFSLQETK
jgi:hypothetical protein